MTSNALDEAGLPDVLMQAGLYVADKQRELAEARWVLHRSPSCARCVSC
jgi:hypothetical protein